MNPCAPVRRLGSISLIAGTVLFAAATAFHPPTVSPGDTQESLLAAALSHWTLDHWALLAATLLLFPGLLALGETVRSVASSGFSSLAAGCAVASFVLWTLLFTFEAAGWPVLARKLGQETARLIGAAGSASLAEVSGLMAVAEAGWRTTLATGYVAAFLLGAAAALWGLDLLSLSLFPAWFGRLAVAAGLTTAIAQPIAWSSPALALPLLAPGAALLAVWFLAAGWFLWPRAGRPSECEAKEPGGAPSQGEGYDDRRSFAGGDPRHGQGGDEGQGLD